MAAGNNFGQMVAEGLAAGQGQHPSVVAGIVEGRIIAGSIGGTLNNLMGLGARNQIPAILQPQTYPLTLVSSGQAQTNAVVGQFGDFNATKVTMAVLSSGAAQAVSTYTFQFQMQFGRTDFLWASERNGVFVAELFNLVASGTYVCLEYVFPRVIRLERASLVKFIFTNAAATTPSVGVSLHGWYDLAYGQQSAI